MASRLQLYMHDGHILYIHGSKRSGKSSLLRYLERLESGPGLMLDLGSAEYRALFAGDMEGLAHEMRLAGYREGSAFLLLLDDIQEAPDLVDAVQSLRPEIQIVMTGDQRSLIFDEEGSIFNRFMIFPLMPLNFREYLEFMDRGELLDILPDEAFALQSALPEAAAEELRLLFADFLIHGGYPETAGIETAERRDVSEAFFNELLIPYLEKQLPYEYWLKKKSDFYRFMLYIAGMQGQPFNETAAARDHGHRFETMSMWKSILEDHGIIHRIGPWTFDNPNEIRKADKLFLRDTGLRNALTGNFNSLERRIDLEDLLRQYFAHIIGEYPQWRPFYWQTKQGQSVDFLLVNDFDKVPVDIRFRSQRPSYLKRFIQRQGLDRGICITMDRFERAEGLSFLPAYLF